MCKWIPDVTVRKASMILWVTGTVLSGSSCSESDSVAPSSPGAESPVSSEKERQAADLGPPSGAEAARFSASLSATAASGMTIPYAPKPGPFAHALPPCDDCIMVSGAPIGFSFTFYGSIYTDFYISSNGFIGFGPAGSSGCCSGQPIPSSDGINNIIAAAWTDLYSPGGGGVFYETRGQAPNRYLIVAYQQIPWCCEFGVDRVTSQIVLYEGTNAIEIHTGHQSSGHIYTQGTEDANGALASFLPGRVAANYALTNDAVRFTTFGNFWTERAPLPASRQRPASASAGGTLYLLGGLNSAGTAQRGVFGYSPSSNSWTTKAPLPAPRFGAGAAAISGKVYLPGGLDPNGKPTRSLYAYTTSTNSWATKAMMPVASGCGGSVAISGKLYVFSGCTLLSTGVQVSAGLLHRYDPGTNSWTKLASAPESHFSPVVAMLNGRLYIAGGNNSSGSATARVDMYDPATNSWATLAPMPTARVAATGMATGGFLYIMGGRTGSTYLSSSLAYNPVTDSWSVRATMPSARSGLAGSLVVSDGKFYAVGGRNSTTVVATNQRYTP
jgi:N-acetylneuraminic acid mutarotase